MAIRDRITWGSQSPLSDPRLAGLDKFVDGIWEGRMPRGVKGGSVFRNARKDLPEKPEGYYHEYDVEPEVKGQARGLLRLVLGAEGEVYITGDHYGDYGVGFRQIIGMPIPALEAARAKRLKEVLARLQDLDNQRQQLQNQVNLMEGEHRAQLDLLTTSFAGFAANALFNKNPPQLVIWGNAHGRLVAARTAIQNRDVKKAWAELQRARQKHLWAMKKYLTWKEGIEPAARKLQIAIGVTAVAIVAVAVVAAVAAPAAGAGVAAEGAGGVAATEAAAAAVQQTLVRVAPILVRVDAMVMAQLEAEALAAAEAEADAILETGLKMVERLP